MRVDPLLSDDVIGDEVRVGQVILNLLTNAVKFTSRGGAVVLHVRQWEDAEVREGLLPVQISVMDTGIGIPRDKLTKIFHPFEQADDSVTRKFGGTGLGLSIISRLVDLMGGALKAESQVGVGSVFHVWLTFTLDMNANKRKEIEQREAAGESRPSPTLKGVRALVVEDNTVNQRVIVKILQKGGIESVIANNGEEALSILTRGGPLQENDSGFDIVLMDCQMPLMDGYEATRLFRMHERASGRHTPVIAMTAHALQGDREKCLSAGMDDYISKPINSKELFNIIEQTLTSRGTRTTP
jgi:CheY-like chemotaxis protein/anti-sigma regulatory factor (Ser/Thr protein kinase)